MPKLWPHMPTRVIERLAFSTDVRQTPTGEMRDSLHDAVQVLEFDHIFQDAEAVWAEMLFREQPLGDWLVPIWTDMTRHAGTLAAGATDISSLASGDYRAGYSAVLSKGYRDTTEVEISSWAGGTLAFSSPLAAEVVGSAANPTLVAPALTCIAVDPLTLSKSHSASRGTVSFRVQQPKDLDPGSAIFPTFGGLEVFTDEQVITSPLSGRIAQAYELLESGHGAAAFESLRSIVEQRSTVSMVAATAAARWRLKQLLHRLRGRETSFWLPSQKRDLVLAAPIGAADTQITIAAVTDSPAQLIDRAIEIENDGTFYHRTISDSQASGDNLLLTITALGAAVPATARLSLMLRVRLDTDEPTLEHQLTSDGWFTTFSETVVEVAA